MRFLTQIGATPPLCPATTPAMACGQWELADAYRYITEGYAGYHMDVQHGLNFQAGIFMSFIGLYSYYSFDNWGYQPSYVSSNTPWFFTGFRMQWFPDQQAEDRTLAHQRLAVLRQVQRPPRRRRTDSLAAHRQHRLCLESLCPGHGHVRQPIRHRYHEDDSQEWKYYESKDKMMHRMGVTFTEDYGCEPGGGVVCVHGNAATPAQNFAGIMVYNRFWFAHDKFGATIGGGVVTNPGRYLVLLPPINGATATTGTPYFPEAPGQKFKAYDFQVTFDWMPTQFVTWRAEFTQRGANVPYFTGPGGLTPPNPTTGSFTNYGYPGNTVPGWQPDLRKEERRWIFALMVKL